MDKAHLHIGNGEEYEAQGLLIPAAQEFYRAAELFMACADKAHDPGVKNTLKMLYNENNRRGKELQRKIQKMRDEGKDPSIPFGIKRTQSPQILTGGLRIPRHDSPSRGFRSQDSAMLTSQRTLDDSYMVLGSRSDPQDPFNHFWTVLEGMLDNLSQPVAFASAPLVPPEARAQNVAAHAREGSSEDETGEGDGRVQRANDLFASAVHATKASTSSPIDQTQVLPPAEIEDLEELLSDRETDMEDSFFFVPSVVSPSMKLLQAENTTLKAELQMTKTRLANAEQVIRNRQEQEKQLKDSILMVRREAQRAISNSTLGSRQLSAQTLDAMFAGVLPAPGTSQTPSSASQEAQYVLRIRELEEEIRLSRIENEKNRLTIARFRERWEKLKESAKRKRSARAAAEAEARAGGSGVNETIQEEPELEDVADELAKALHFTVHMGTACQKKRGRCTHSVGDVVEVSKRGLNRLLPFSALGMGPSVGDALKNLESVVNKRKEPEAVKAFQSLKKELPVVEKTRVNDPKVVEQLIVLLSDTIQPCYRHHLLPTLDIVDSIVVSIIHSRIYPKGKSPTRSGAQWESVLTKGILAGLSEYMDPIEQLDKKSSTGLANILVPTLSPLLTHKHHRELTIDLRRSVAVLFQDLAAVDMENKGLLKEHLGGQTIGDLIAECQEFRLLDALLDLLARMVPAIGKGSKRELFISSVFNAKAMRNAFPTARRQELQRILNSAKPDTWEDSREKIIKLFGQDDLTRSQGFNINGLTAIGQTFPSQKSPHKLYIDSELVLVIWEEEDSMDTLNCAVETISHISIQRTSVTITLNCLPFRHAYPFKAFKEDNPKPPFRITFSMSDHDEVRFIECLQRRIPDVFVQSDTTRLKFNKFSVTPGTELGFIGTKDERSQRAKNYYDSNNSKADPFENDSAVFGVQLSPEARGPDPLLVQPVGTTSNHKTETPQPKEPEKTPPHTKEKPHSRSQRAGQLFDIDIESSVSSPKIVSRCKTRVPKSVSKVQLPLSPATSQSTRTKPPRSEKAKDDVSPTSKAVNSSRDNGNITGETKVTYPRGIKRKRVIESDEESEPSAKKSTSEIAVIERKTPSPRPKGSTYKTRRNAAKANPPPKIPPTLIDTNDPKTGQAKALTTRKREPRAQSSEANTIEEVVAQQPDTHSSARDSNNHTRVSESSVLQSKDKSKAPSSTSPIRQRVIEALQHGPLPMVQISLPEPELQEAKAVSKPGRKSVKAPWEQPSFDARPPPVPFQGHQQMIQVSPKPADQSPIQGDDLLLRPCSRRQGKAQVLEPSTSKSQVPRTRLPQVQSTMSREPASTIPTIAQITESEPIQYRVSKTVDGSGGDTEDVHDRLSKPSGPHGQPTQTRLRFDKLVKADTTAEDTKERDDWELKFKRQVFAAPNGFRETSERIVTGAPERLNTLPQFLRHLSAGSEEHEAPEIEGLMEEDFTMEAYHTIDQRNDVSDQKVMLPHTRLRTIFDNLSSTHSSPTERVASQRIARGTKRPALSPKNYSPPKNIKAETKAKAKSTTVSCASRPQAKPRQTKHLKSFEALAKGPNRVPYLESDSSDSGQEEQQEQPKSEMDAIKEVLNAIQDAILNNIGRGFEAVRTDILSGRERILCDARGHLGMMQEELWNSYSEFVELEREYGAIGRKLDHAHEEFNIASDAVIAKLRNTIHDHDRNSLSRRLPASVFSRPLPAFLQDADEA